MSRAASAARVWKWEMWTGTPAACPIWAASSIPTCEFSSYPPRMCVT